MQAERLLQWEYNHLTATYFVLLSRKQVMKIKFDDDGFKGEMTELVQAGKEWQLLPSPLPDLISTVSTTAGAEITPLRSVLGELQVSLTTNQKY